MEERDPLYTRAVGPTQASERHDFWSWIVTKLAAVVCGNLKVVGAAVCAARLAKELMTHTHTNTHTHTHAP